MKFNFLLLLQLPLIFLFLHGHKSSSIHAHKNYVYAVQKDTTLQSWIDDFKAFRNAVYSNDTTKLKSYFSFPVKGSNEIWYLVLNGKELQEKIITDSTPFTENDFSKYHKKLFSGDFIKTLLKIKSADLLRKGNSESPVIKEGNTNIKLYASYSRKEKTVTLNLSYNTPWKEENGVEQEGGESNIIYTFRILKNNRLRFVKVMIAG